MALQPSLRPLLIAGRPDAPHTLDIFLDYVCPFSRKLSRAIDNIVKPLVDIGGKYEGKIKIIFRNQVQPWHGSSTFTHEAGLAVALVAPEKFWSFSLILLNRQDEYYDIPTSTLTPVQIREKLASLFVETGASVNEVNAFTELLKLKGTPNGGVSVTDELKYTVKFSRQNGVHVSPSVLWDGILANEISSSWGDAEWTQFLAQKVVV
ncbi:hypothetical protein B0F90DRAFT_1622059 [Multifurca ochricompacta]|uniref:Thioredoxin-like fold domain-containing protein n=1 Tax=Multifurca ochricompacta TaxID=376703 RepID=A0AAD4MB03_9AGAM|nr:hypothetical protein B0F90DRAFT_1622059 [Multifurca ochricompacta]